MNQPEQIIKDTRPISYLKLGAEMFVDVSEEDNAAIVPYFESGQMSPVVWFAVYDQQGEIIMRINGATVYAVGYS